MNKKQYNQILDNFESGTEKVSEADLTSIMSQKEKAFALSQHLGKAANDFNLLWGLLCDYKSGVYREVPWKLIAAIVFAISYLLLPLDVIPDIIPVVGFADDLTVFGFVLAGFAAELDSYKNWKEKQPSLPDMVSGKEEK